MAQAEEEIIARKLDVAKRNHKGSAPKPKRDKRRNLPKPKSYKKRSA
jgi:hypothetical protein